MASILKIVITQDTIYDNLVSFPKSGHIYRLSINRDIDHVDTTYTNCQSTRGKDICRILKNADIHNHYRID